MKKTNQSINKRLEEERDSWKETALVLGDSELMKSINVSLKELANGKGIPLKNL